MISAEGYTPNTYRAAITFKSSSNPWSYSLRTALSNIPQTNLRTAVFNSDFANLPYFNTYYTSSLVHLQALADEFILAQTLGVDAKPHSILRYSVNQYPTPKYNVDNFWSFFQFFMVLLLLFAVNCAYCAKFIEFFEQLETLAIYKVS